MHYRNGREAKNGDKIVALEMGEGGHVEAVGILRDATPGNDYCNRYVQIGSSPSNDDPVACMCDCLHADDVAEIMKKAGYGVRPPGM